MIETNPKQRHDSVNIHTIYDSKGRHKIVKKCTMNLNRDNLKKDIN